MIQIFSDVCYSSVCLDPTSVSLPLYPHVLKHFNQQIKAFYIERFRECLVSPFGMKLVVSSFNDQRTNWTKGDVTSEASDQVQTNLLFYSNQPAQWHVTFRSIFIITSPGDAFEAAGQTSVAPQHDQVLKSVSDQCHWWSGLSRGRGNPTTPKRPTHT